MHLVFDEWAKIYGGVFKYFLGTSPFVMVSGKDKYRIYAIVWCKNSSLLSQFFVDNLADPALVQQICTRRFVQFHDRGSLQTANSEPKVIEFQNKSTLLARYVFFVDYR